MNTEEKLLKSALDLFVEKGFSANTSKITKNAGVSTGILFHYYPTKNDLIFALYSKNLLEYYKVTAPLFGSFNENDLSKYTNTVKLSWAALVNWGLNNWQEFQYIQLFESSLLADQFNT